MKKFIAVIHKWHVGSKGFEVEELSAETLESANEKAALMTYDAKRPCTETAFCIVEIGAAEAKSRKLTFRERLTGTLKI